MSGAASAVANQLAIKKVAEYLGEHFDEESPEFRTLLQLASSAIGAAVDGANGAAVALSATQNNYLNHPERMAYLKAAKECAQTGESCGVAAQYEDISNVRNEALKQACTDRSSAGCRAALDDAMKAAEDQKAHQAEYASWMNDNLGTLAALDGTRNNETLMDSVVTHTSTLDVEHKITCAMAGSNCSDSALALQAYLGNVPKGYATQDALLRAALTGIGTHVGSATRVGETVVGLAQAAWGLMPYEQLQNSYSDLSYLYENGASATLARNFSNAASALGALKDGVKDYASGIGSAIATDALGSWDIYDLYEQGKTQGKVGIDILSLLVPGAGAAGKAGVVGRTATVAEGAAAKTADDVIDAINAARSTASKGDAGYPKLPPGYTTLKSGGAAANETGGLPDGFRRILNSEGDVVIQSASGNIYKEVDISAGQKGGWNKELNKPEPNTIYNVDDNKVYRTNSNGDVEYVEANLSLSTNDRNKHQQCKVGKCGNVGDEGGHLVASIFDGPGEKLNLVPMNSNLNKGAWKAMENEWANALREGNSVKIKIEPTYSGSGRPDEFNVTYQIGSDAPVTQTFRNSPKGI